MLGGRLLLGIFGLVAGMLLAFPAVVVTTVFALGTLGFGFGVEAGFAIAKEAFSNCANNSLSSAFLLRPSENNIEVIAFVEVFNRNLQFLKKETNFESSYDLNISLISEDGSKIDEKSFSETIVVENFSQTVSRANPILITTSFIIPLQEFNINFSLKDMDTKLIGKKQKKFTKKNLPSGKYSKIFDPIFVKNKKGSWEFGLNKYPISIVYYDRNS